MSPNDSIPDYIPHKFDDMFEGIDSQPSSYEDINKKKIAFDASRRRALMLAEANRRNMSNQGNMSNEIPRINAPLILADYGPDYLTNPTGPYPLKFTPGNYHNNDRYDPNLKPQTPKFYTPPLDFSHPTGGPPPLTGAVEPASFLGNITSKLGNISDLFKGGKRRKQRRTIKRRKGSKKRKSNKKSVSKRGRTKKH
jgi:hypothetical protein